MTIAVYNALIIGDNVQDTQGNTGFVTGTGIAPQGGAAKTVKMNNDQQRLIYPGNLNNWI